MARRAARFAGGSHGQALVELAILLPVVLLLAVAIVDLGNALQRYVVLTDAVRDGARYGSLYGTRISAADHADPRNVKYHVRREAESLGITEADIVVYYEVYGGNPAARYDASVIANRQYAVTGNFLRVEASYEYVPFAPYRMIVAPSGSFTIRASATMQLQ